MGPSENHVYVLHASACCKPTISMNGVDSAAAFSTLLGPAIGAHSGLHVAGVH